MEGGTHWLANTEWGEKPSLSHRNSIATNRIGQWFLVQTVKSLPAMQETQVQSLGWEVPLEKEMAIHSSILAWRILWTEEPGGLQSKRLQRVRQD